MDFRNNRRSGLYRLHPEIQAVGLRMWEEGFDPETDYPNGLINYILDLLEYVPPSEIPRVQWWISEIRRSTFDAMPTAASGTRFGTGDSGPYPREPPPSLFADSSGDEAPRPPPANPQGSRSLREPGVGSSAFSDSEGEHEEAYLGARRASQKLCEPGVGSSAFSDSEDESDGPIMLGRWLREY
ncbi:hypothetical protein BU23DRAFT_566038 [Bimuria novae-zelandiae CBS 107.79]|uniref:Uncharacterized protein n=1 Tax=Bimuria novae-zelandiae CBS 107.79 TaxID=1447943 RepID=A0A6A5VGQ7_9PLEO|nr:hypothetical protein BU23DRAFT_566038 [Bimuria novae-zelandiae CBS 107.79]